MEAEINDNGTADDCPSLSLVKGQRIDYPEQRGETHIKPVRKPTIKPNLQRVGILSLYRTGSSNRRMSRSMTKLKTQLH